MPSCESDGRLSCCGNKQSARGVSVFYSHRPPSSIAHFVQIANREVRDVFDDDAMSWFDRSYAVDWAVATMAWFVAQWIKAIAPYEREFSVDDTLISHKHRPNQISGNMNITVALGVPLLVVVILGTVIKSAIHIHHGLLSLYSGSAFTALITEALKNRVAGRLRPDFLSRCKWKEAIAACSGKLETVQDGRRSFPSGHSSEAFAGMTFLSLFLAGITGAWLFQETLPSRALTSSRLARLFLTLFPMAFATWVAVSRLEDYRHHKEDVIVGSLLGAFTAATCYFIYWPNPFVPQVNPAIRQVLRPRQVYGEVNTRALTDDYGYELTRVEQTDAPV
ncbi:phosphatidic acid phosphatase type 2/haloperoxidase [Cytidiella melzeri]|nr:phosphatidic acid phosphatase type 2/haloperoxidase [Cytidiella melzeri]